MSNAGGGLPTSLTPQVLRDILRYDSQHWKIIKRRLVKKSAIPWEDMSLSDDNFYDKLHEVLKDPEKRFEFELATRKRGNSNRVGDLYRRIVRHYIDELRHQDTFREEIPANATHRPSVGGHAGRRRADPPKRAPARANVGRAAAPFKADGLGKSGNAPPFVPMRAVPCDGADNARPDVVVSLPGVLHPRPARPPPRPDRCGAEMPEFEPSCIRPRRIHRRHRQRQGKRDLNRGRGVLSCDGAPL